MRSSLFLSLIAVAFTTALVVTPAQAQKAKVVTPKPTSVTKAPITTPVAPQPNTLTENAKKASISFDLDDGYANQLEGIAVFNKMQIPFTLGIITQANTKRFDPLGTLYLNDAQIKMLSLNPLASFASHSVTHADLAKSTPAQIRSELMDSRNYLQNLISRRVRYFIAPYCSTNAEAVGQAKEIYDWVSVCGGNNNSVGKLNAYQVDRKMVESTTTTTEITAWINEAKSNGYALVLTYHNTTSNPVNGMEQNVTPAVLTQQLQIAKSSGVLIIPTEAALKRFSLLK
jgi:peptidoglycan/xylan/chitin deacetylase (PgdA/CDA1 family)